MKPFLRFLLITILWALTGACRREPQRLHPFKWPAIQHSIDSLTLDAERLWIKGDGNPDSLLHTIALIDSIAPTLKGEDRNAAIIRSIFWNARYLKGSGHPDEARKKIAGALQLCDSASDPYSYNRLLELHYLISNPDSKDFFRFLLSSLDYYTEIGDLPQEANAAILISNSLNNAEPENSLKYLLRADSLYTLLKFEPYKLKNRINMASLLHASGDTIQSKKILEDLIANKVIKRDKSALVLVLRNHYDFFHDSTSLFRAYSIVRGSTVLTDTVSDTIPRGTINYRAFYEAQLCEYYAQMGMPDSARHYAILSRRHMGELGDRRMQNIVYLKNAGYSEYAGDSSRAYEFLMKHVLLSDSLEADNQPRRKQYMENMNVLRLREMENENANRRMKQKYYLIVAGLILLIAALVIIFRHRRQIQKMKAMQTQLELERGQRKLMALSISREESNKILDYVKEEVTRLSGDGRITPNDISQIERNIRLHFAGRSEMESFEQTFENVNPEFIRRLKEVSPSISENNIRLCSYILIGLSNRQIAELMNVRPASIKQSRWRLRTRLGLNSDDSLEDFLRHLAE